MSPTHTAAATRHLGRFLALLVVLLFVASSCNTGDSPTAPQSLASTTGVGANIHITPGSHVDIETATNGADADDPLGPQIPVGDPVAWTYTVMNNGSLPLIGIVVTDDQLGVIDCPRNTLASGQTMVCTAEGIAEAGQYANLATVAGTTSQGVDAADEDPSHYFGITPGVAVIDLEKATNAEDADEETGPEIVVGDPVTWTFDVTNTGDVALEQIVVTDDQLGEIECPADALAPGEGMICNVEGVAVEGQYVNIGTVVAFTTEGEEVGDEDASHYLGVAFAPVPEIDIEKATNGADADGTPGPVVTVGDAVTWTYLVTNTGNVDLTGVAVTDNQIGPIACPASALAVGESMSCETDGTAVDGQYVNVGSVTAMDAEGTVVDDSDTSHYFGLEEVPEALTCGHGYWKNHLADWAPTPYSPDDLIGDIFDSTHAWTYIAESTLLEGLRFPGGPGVDGAIRIVMRQAIAALLNASHPDFSSPSTVADIIDQVNTAIESNDRKTILKLNGHLIGKEDGACFDN